MFYIENYTTAATYVQNLVTMKNFRESKSYKFTCWAENSLGNVSLPFSGDFTTKSNEGKMMQLGLAFLGELSVWEKQRVSCLFCSMLAIPCDNVMSYDAYFCPNYTYTHVSDDPFLASA